MGRKKYIVIITKAETCFKLNRMFNPTFEQKLHGFDIK